MSTIPTRNRKSLNPANLEIAIIYQASSKLIHGNNQKIKLSSKISTQKSKNSILLMSSMIYALSLLFLGRGTNMSEISIQYVSSLSDNQNWMICLAPNFKTDSSSQCSINPMLPITEMI